jgi:hypothetical protein
LRLFVPDLFLCCALHRLALSRCNSAIEAARERARHEEECQLRELEEAERQEEEERWLAEEEAERQRVEAEERRLAAEKVKALKARREEERRETERVRVAHRATEASSSGAAAMIIDMDATIEALGKARCYACVKKGMVACVRQ